MSDSKASFHLIGVAVVCRTARLQYIYIFVGWRRVGAAVACLTARLLHSVGFNRAAVK